MRLALVTAVDFFLYFSHWFWSCDAIALLSIFDTFQPKKARERNQLWTGSISQYVWRVCEHCLLFLFVIDEAYLIFMGFHSNRSFFVSVWLGGFPYELKPILTVMWKCSAFQVGVVCIFFPFIHPFIGIKFVLVISIWYRIVPNSRIHVRTFNCGNSISVDWSMKMWLEQFQWSCSVCVWQKLICQFIGDLVNNWMKLGPKCGENEIDQVENV